MAWCHGVLVSHLVRGPKSGRASTVQHMSGTKLGEWVCGSPSRGVREHDLPHVCQGTDHFGFQRGASWQFIGLFPEGSSVVVTAASGLQETEQKASLSQEKS